MGAAVVKQVQACLDCLKPVLPKDARERLERKEAVEQGGYYGFLLLNCLLSASSPQAPPVIMCAYSLHGFGPCPEDCCHSRGRLNIEVLGEI